MLKVSSIFILFVFSIITSESFEDFQKAQKAGVKSESQAFKNYEKQAAKEFADFQKEQQEAFNNWIANYGEASKSGLRRISLPEGESKNRPIMYDIDYSKGSIEARALGAGSTPEIAKERAQKAVRAGLTEAFENGDPSVKLTEQQIKKIEKAPVRDTIIVRETEKGYIAEASATQTIKTIMPAVIDNQIKSKTHSSTAATSYTSLIIDARNLSFKACLVPVLEDEKGNQLYGPKLVNKESAVNGMAVYVNNMEAAASSQKCGSKPITLKADSVRDSRYLKLKDKSAETLALLKESSIVKDCKVIIILD